MLSNRYSTRAAHLSMLVVLGVAMSACRSMTDPNEPNGGRITFWTDDSRLVPLSVRLTQSNHSGMITAAFPSPPECGAPGAYTVNVSAGSHQYTARSAEGNFTSDVIDVADGECKTLRFFVDRPRTGDVLFWTDDASLTPITVRLNGGSPMGFVTARLFGVPTCGTPGGYTVSLPSGPATYSASTPYGDSGTGTVDVIAGACILVKFSRAAQTTGEVMFWTKNPGLVPITVRVNNGQYTGSVSASFAAATSCGLSGGYTMTMPPGRYPVTATNGRGANWTTTADIEAGVCLTIELQ
jgi:hypothetical protein